MELPGRQYLEQDTDFLAPHLLFPPRKGTAGTGDVTGRCGRIGGQKENGVRELPREGGATRMPEPGMGLLHRERKRACRWYGCCRSPRFASMPVVRMLQISPVCDRALTARRQGSVTWSPRLCGKSTVGTWEAPPAGARRRKKRRSASLRETMHGGGNGGADPFLHFQRTRILPTTNNGQPEHYYLLFPQPARNKFALSASNAAALSSAFITKETLLLLPP